MSPSSEPEARVESTSSVRSREQVIGPLFGPEREAWQAEVAMLFPLSAVERAMQVKEVILRAMNKEFSWFQAAEILGLTARGLRRLRQRMEQFGYEGLVDRRYGRPSHRRTPVAEMERILELYRERYVGFNVRHFVAIARREHGVKLSYTCIKQMLQGAGLVKKRRARGRHRRRRERRPRFGQMLHLDGSPHEWMALCPGQRQTLIQVVDDATSRVLYSQLWPGETVRAVMAAMDDVVRHFGIPEALYTDRAGWAFETPVAGAKVSKTHLTQFGEALKRLGVEHIPSYSPQGRGRSERMNRTVQGRLVNELRVAGVATLEGANKYLRERYLPLHNEEFSVAPMEVTSAFVDPGDTDLEDIFYESQLRTVAKDNTVSLEGTVLQIAKQPGRVTCAGLVVEVRRQLDGGFTVRRGAQRFGRFDPAGRPRTATHTKSQASAGVDTHLLPALTTSRRLTASARRAAASARLRLASSATRTVTAPSKL